MRKNQSTEEQMVKILRECDRFPGRGRREEARVSEQALNIWRKNFGTIEAADAKRLKGLEAENARLKNLLAERNLRVEVMIPLQ